MTFGEGGCNELLNARICTALLTFPFCECGSREELTLVLELNNRTQCHNAFEFPFSVTVF